MELSRREILYGAASVVQVTGSLIMSALTLKAGISYGHAQAMHGDTIDPAIGVFTHGISALGLGVSALCFAWASGTGHDMSKKPGAASPTEQQL